MRQTLKLLGHEGAKLLPPPYGADIWEFDKDELDMIAPALEHGMRGVMPEVDTMSPRAALVFGLGGLVVLLGWRAWQTRTLVKQMQAMAAQQQGVPAQARDNPAAAQAYTGGQVPQGAPPPMPKAPDPDVAYPNYMSAVEYAEMYAGANGAANPLEGVE